MDQVVAEQGMSNLLNKIKKLMKPGVASVPIDTPGIIGSKEYNLAQEKEYKRFNNEFAEYPRAAVIAKLKQYSPGKKDEIDAMDVEGSGDRETIDNLIDWVKSGKSSWTGPQSPISPSTDRVTNQSHGPSTPIKESTEDWGFSQYNITLHD